MVRAGVSSPSETRMSLSPRAGYDAWAPIYDGDGNPLIAVEGPAVASLLGDLRGLLALDVGCGTGRHALAMAEAGARVVGLDPSAELAPWLAGALRDSADLATIGREQVQDEIGLAQLRLAKDEHFQRICRHASAYAPVPAEVSAETISLGCRSHRSLGRDSVLSCCFDCSPWESARCQCHYT